MDEKTYKITLTDGTVIDDLKLNGNNYISAKSIDPAIFEYNCSLVVINDGNVDEVHPNMEFVQVTQTNGEYWLVLRDVSDEEIAKLKLQSDIEYVAMMAGVEL